MATVTVLDGALAGGASTAWAAVAASRAYLIQLNGTNSAQLSIELSVDGTNNITPASGTLVNMSQNAFDNKTFRVLDTPVAFMRATNTSGSSVTAKVYVQAV